MANSNCAYVTAMAVLIIFLLILLTVMSECCLLED